MKNKVIFLSIFIVILGFLLTQRAKTEPNYSYKIYTPQNFSEISKNVEKNKDGGQILFIVDFSNSMGEYLEHKTKVNQVKDMMHLLYTFLVNSESRVCSTCLAEPSGRYSLQWDYIDFREVNERLFPMKMDVKWMKGGVSQGEVTIAFSRIQTDVPVKMDFSIPSGYKRITLAQILKSLSNKK